MPWIFCAKNGKTMMNAYSSLYLDDAMANLGSMLDFAVGTCGESLDVFYGRFLASGIDREMDSGNPKYLCGMSGIELAMAVAQSTGSSLHGNDDFIDIGSPEYWTGWSLAYIRWNLSADFKTIQRCLPITELYVRYPVLHEADLSKTLAFAQNALAEYDRAGNPLQRARQNAGLTQRELAYLSGTTIRAIRSWEQGQNSLLKASHENVRRLCYVLGCTPEEILPVSDRGQ